MYKVEIRKKILKKLQKMDKTIRLRLMNAIDELALEPRQSGAAKMTDSIYWKKRIGNYRIVYEIQDDKLIIVIINVDHRSRIYQNR